MFTANAERDPDSMNPFDYSKQSGENNITLVIDTVFNRSLRRKYHDIEKLEKERSLTSGGSKTPRCNPIIVIGFFQENTINSMCLCNNYCLMSDAYSPRSNISDIDYEMWYFYSHC